MIENFKKFLTSPITIEKHGRGEVINFYNYRITKSGKITDINGNTVKPIIKNGIAYIPVNISGNKENKTIDVEVGRIIYCYLIKDIDIFNDFPKIIYKDNDGTNFKLENLKIEDSVKRSTTEILTEDEEKQTKKYFDVDDVLEEADILEDIELDEKSNPVDELGNFITDMETIFDKKTTEINENLVKEINNKANRLISTDFVQEINSKIELLKTTIDQLKSMREMDSIDFQNKLKEKDTLIEQLKLSIAKREKEINDIVLQNEKILSEKALLEKNYVILTKNSFVNMYNTMKKVLEMIDQLKK